MRCGVCKNDVDSALTADEGMSAAMLGVTSKGYKCDICGEVVCTRCYAQAATSAETPSAAISALGVMELSGAARVTHDCGGTFRPRE